MPFFKVSIEMGLSYMLFDFSVLQLSVFFLCSLANCFKYDNLLRGSILIMSFWCSGGFLYLDGHLFLKIWEE
jgi:hypothetical protein